MDSSLPIVYVSSLLVLLSVSAWFLFRQILRTRRIETSLTRLQSKLTKEKGTVQEYYELGSIFLNKQLYTQAITLFQKALQAKDVEEVENLAPVYNALGFTYFAQEQYDLAIRNYKEALKTDPDYVNALNNLGHAYERKKLITQALKAYEQALSHEPNNAVSKRRTESLRKRIAPST